MITKIIIIILALAMTSCHALVTSTMLWAHGSTGAFEAMSNEVMFCLSLFGVLCLCIVGTYLGVVWASKP